jgi:PAS domain S-box-containing protein
MDVQPRDPAEEIKGLERCINDLVSVLALPAMWSGGDPSRIVDTLLDALLGMLQVDLVYVRLKDPGGQAPIEMVRCPQSQKQMLQPHEIGEALKPWLGADAQAWPLLIRNPIGPGDLSIVPLGLGLQGEMGVIVAGSERADFPRQTERLILSVAANQASIGLQEARVRSEQKRVASELDRRVAQRTAELAAANEELRKEIADRKRAEEDLRSSEEKHRLVVETASDAVISMDDHGTIQFANPATAIIFGYDPAELVGRPLTVLMPEFMRELHDRGFRRFLATGQRHINWRGTELTALRKDGHEFPVEVSFGELTRDGHKLFTGFIRDISERKQAADKLRASERDLSLIIETIPGLIWCAAPDGELTYLNKRLLDYTGTSHDDWAKQGWANLLHPDDAAPSAHAWAHAVATGQPHEVQFRLRRSDGVYRWFQVLGQAARDSEGGVVRWYGLLIDIHDRKYMEEALRESQAQLSRAIQKATVGEFAAAIAHEINQPLAAVVANGQACLRWLAAQPSDIAKAREAAERIVRDGKESGEVVRRIRALFRQAALEKIELDLNEVIAEVLRLLNDETAKKRITVETDLDQDLAPVAGDRVQLQQLVFNLLLNGIEAMEPVVDGLKRLSIRSRHSSPETVLVEVRDSGIGLKDPDRIFDAFFTTKESGMGMGLAICRSIVAAHQGRLWAASGEGPGSIFSFTLPAKAGLAS